MISVETDSEIQTTGRMAGTKSPRESLDAMFNPSSVAVIGATDRPGTVGRKFSKTSCTQVFGETCISSTHNAPKSWE